jgi:hypothetical protein
VDIRVQLAHTCPNNYLILFINLSSPSRDSESLEKAKTLTEQAALAALGGWAPR